MLYYETLSPDISNNVFCESWSAPNKVPVNTLITSSHHYVDEHLNNERQSSVTTNNEQSHFINADLDMCGCHGCPLMPDYVATQH